MRDWIKQLVEGSPYINNDAEEGAVFRKMAESSECDIVWKAIERKYAEVASLDSANAQGGMNNDAVGIARTVIFAQRPQHFAEAATKAKRRGTAKKADKAIEQLLGCLSMFCDGYEGCFWNDIIFDELKTVGDRASDKFVEMSRSVLTYREMSGEVVDDFLNIVSNTDAVDLARQVGRWASTEPLEALQALRIGFKNWANEKPMMPMPNELNASRLRLIRELTRYFRQRFNTPLRAQVLAITGVFFDCDGLGDSDIAKLAP